MAQEANEPALKGKQAKAAALLAEGELTETQICTQLKMSRTNLVRWKRLPVFQVAVADIARKLEAETVYFSVARKRHRLEVLQDLEDRHLRLLAARSGDPELTKVPGGDTGLLVKTLKVIGTGPNQEVVEEYRRDEIGRDIIAIHEQARKETGEDKDAKAGLGALAGQITIRRS